LILATPPQRASFSFFYHERHEKHEIIMDLFSCFLCGSWFILYQGALPAMRFSSAQPVRVQTGIIKKIFSEVFII